MSDVIVRSTIEAIVGHRNAALRLYEDAFEKIRAASDAIASANSSVRAACYGEMPKSAFNMVAHAPEVDAFHNAVALPDPEQYLRVARRLCDIQVWCGIIDHTEIDHMMDKQGIDELRAQLAYVPEKIDSRTGELINGEEIAKGFPDVTVENIEETLRGLIENRGAIFRRGLANAFSDLDRRFRSHDGFKIGSRMILDRAFDENGHWNYYRNLRATLTDIERVFLILDKKEPRANYAGIVGTIEAERKGLDSWGGLKSEHTGDYFYVRVFKNGNAHLWFTRKDLLAEVNKLLAEHYGASLGDGPGGQDDPEAAMKDRAVGHANNFGYFPSPKAVVDRVIAEAHIEGGMTVLEPSAGTGALADAANGLDVRVHCIEIQADLVGAQLAGDRFASVRHANFLEVSPYTDSFDRIVMNPPFDRGRDVDHVVHAWDFLKPGGRLVAVMSAGTEFRQDKKTTAFRAFVKRERGYFHDLPDGSFLEAGTNVHTRLLVLEKRNY